ncbi:MAG: D-erythrulose kinase, partial [Frondihabitans sp.]|nr:D-erythrulose kinase [Frondihabitans sp.]
QQVARLIVTALDAMKSENDRKADELGLIDAEAGDGDHGIGMQRGVTAGVEAARKALEQGAGSQTVLERAGDAWSDRAGGTSGALWGSALVAVGAALTDTETPDRHRVAAGVAQATIEILEFGAVVGDKTMVDVLVPFGETLTARVNAGGSLVEAWNAAADVASDAAAATSGLLPKMGRARPHAEKSLGTPDAGAVSLGLIVRAVGDVLAAGPASVANPKIPSLEGEHHG